MVGISRFFPYPKHITVSHFDSSAQGTHYTWAAYLFRYA